MTSDQHLAEGTISDVAHGVSPPAKPIAAFGLRLAWLPHKSSYLLDNDNYYNSSVNSKRFDIRDHVEFDQNGRALCPSCSPNHSNNKKTLSLVPNTDGAYKCFRDCTTEEIREALGQPKTKIVPTALAKTPPKQNVTKSEQEIIRMHSDLMGLGDNALKAIRWLANRGITTDIVKKYSLISLVAWRTILVSPDNPSNSDS